MHLILLGDSIFDNASYVSRGEAVIDRVNALLPAGDTATLLAQDGAVIDGVFAQLERVPTDATHLFISAGGNDALRSAGVLLEPSRSVADSLSKILAIRDRFAAAYSRLLDAATAGNRLVSVCTIYDAQLPDPRQRSLSNLALATLNDVITREASRRRLPVLDLRTLFAEPGDYANAIEPSGTGAAKIAEVMLRIARRHDFDGPTMLYGSAGREA